MLRLAGLNFSGEYQLLYYLCHGLFPAGNTTGMTDDTLFRDDCPLHRSLFLIII